MDESEMRAFELAYMLYFHRSNGDVDPTYGRAVRKQIRELRAESRTYKRLIFRPAA